MRCPLLSLSRLLLCATALVFAMGSGLGVEAQGVVADGGPGAQQVAKRHFQDGHAHFVAGRHRSALKAFERANERWPTPELFYNIGRCHEVLGEAAKAVESYRRYLAEVPSAADAGEVRNRIAELLWDAGDSSASSTTAGDDTSVHLEPPMVLERSEFRSSFVDSTVKMDLTPSETVLGAGSGDSNSSSEQRATRQLTDLLNQGSSVAPSADPSVVVWTGVGATGVCLTVATTFFALSMNGGGDEPLGRDRGRLISGAALGTGVVTALLSAIIYAVE